MFKKIYIKYKTIQTNKKMKTNEKYCDKTR